MHFIFITSTLDWFNAWILRIPSPPPDILRQDEDWIFYSTRSFDSSCPCCCCCCYYYYDLHFIGLRFTQPVNAFTMESNPGPGQHRNCCPSGSRIKYNGRSVVRNDRNSRDTPCQWHVAFVGYLFWLSMDDRCLNKSNRVVGGGQSRTY